MSRQATSSFLDASRWFAALLVVVSHVRSLMLVDYAQVDRKTMLVKAVYALGGLGHVAVIVFFVVSGYLVGGRTVMAAAEGRFAPRAFAIQRFTRIYVVFLPALLAGWGLDCAGPAMLGDAASRTYSGHLHLLSVDFPVSDHLGFWNFAANLLMLQTILAPPFGSNGPLWSLANEWWYYVLFGLFMVAVTRPPVHSRLIYGLGFLVILLLLPWGISCWFALWLIGVGAAYVDRRWRGLHPSIALICLLGAVYVARLSTTQAGLGSGTGPGGFAVDAMVALAYGVAVVSAKRGFSVGTAMMHRAFASFSYTTYLVHFPAMMFLVTAIDAAFGVGIAQQPSLGILLLAAAVTLTLYAYAWGFAQMTEAHTDSVRKLMSRLADRAVAASASPKRA